MQRAACVADSIVHCRVARTAQRMEDVGGFRSEHACVAQSSQSIELILVLLRVEPGMRSGGLGERFAKTAQVRQRGDRIAVICALGELTEHDQTAVVFGQESEVAGPGLVHRAAMISRGQPSVWGG